MAYLRGFGWRKTFPRPPADLTSEVDLADRILRASQKETSPWEKNFLDSIKQQLSSKGQLTVAQLGTFKKIEERLNKPVDLSFSSSFTPAMRETYRIACEHYARTPYYGNALSKYKAQLALGTSETFVPEEKDYRALVENKYFQKIIAAIESPARFSAGDLVSVKKINVQGHNRDLYHTARFALVVKVNPQAPFSAALGAKLYRISLFPDNGDGVVGYEGLQLAEERFLRKHK